MVKRYCCFLEVFVSYQQNMSLALKHNNKQLVKLTKYYFSRLVHFVTVSDPRYLKLTMTLKSEETLITIAI